MSESSQPVPPPKEKEVEILFNYHVDEERDKEVGVELSKFNLNFRRQPKDPRDLKLHQIITAPIDESTLPKKVDLRADWKILDQGSLGSCVSNSVAACIRHARIRDKRTVYDPSRLYIYWFGRFIEGTVSEDSGLYVRDAYKAVDTYKVCSENNWPYNIDRFTDKPAPHAVAAASTHNGFKYIAVPQDRVMIKKNLADGYPISFGADLWEDFMSAEVARTGKVPMPDFTQESIGGHCMSIIGYDDDAKVFIIANSWSTTWGDGGFAYIPYDYILNKDHVSDFWTVRSSL